MEKREIEAILSAILLTLLLFGVTVVSWVRYLVELSQSYLELAAEKPSWVTTMDVWLSNEMWTREHLVGFITNVAAVILCLVAVHLNCWLFRQNYQISWRRSRRDWRRENAKRRENEAQS